MLTAIVSALTGTPVSHTVAMTGEITLRGQVLPIGGLKEKVLAAYRNGCTKIILPRENMRDVPEIPESVREKMTFCPVETADQVLAEALVK